MTQYRVWIRDEAKAEVQRLPGNMRQRVRKLIQSLSQEPRPPATRQLRLPEDVELEVRRARMDRYRLIYVVDDDTKEVGVLAVRKRPPYDYGDLSRILFDLGQGA
jgi:mRNA interferase RelE/StbE